MSQEVFQGPQVLAGFEVGAGMGRWADLERVVPGRREALVKPMKNKGYEVCVGGRQRLRV